MEDTTLTAEKEYATKFSEQQHKFCLRLHYNLANIYVFAKGILWFEIFKKLPEISLYCLAALVCSAAAN